MTEHLLKTLPPYWDALESGDKNFEVRRNDRGFQKGDIIICRKFEGLHFVEKGMRSPREYFDLRFEITYVLQGGQLGIEPGYCVLGIKVKS